MSKNLFETRDDFEKGNKKTLFEALKNSEADKDGNKQLWEKEWFDYATNQVPQLQLEAMKNWTREFTEGKQNVEVFYLEDDKTKNSKDPRVQTPRIFYKRETDVNPFVVAKP